MFLPTRQVGSIENDAVRNIQGQFLAFALADGKLFKGIKLWEAGASIAQQNTGHGIELIDFDLSRATQTGPENTVLNQGSTPFVYLGV